MKKIKVEESFDSLDSKFKGEAVVMETLTKKQKMTRIRQMIGRDKKLAVKEGRGSILKFGNDSSVGVTKFSTFNCEGLDSLGNIPHGRFTVLAGPEQCGKTTAAHRAVTSCQQTGGIVAWIDVESQLDPLWAEKQGNNIEELLVIDPNSFNEPTLEAYLDKYRELTVKSLVDMVVIDSVTALGSLGELKDKKGSRSLEDDTIALQARKLSQFFRVATGITSKANCATVLIAQVRTPIGQYGKFESVPGGNALKHYCSFRLLFRRGKKADAPTSKGKYIGFSSVVKVDKGRSLTVTEGDEKMIPFYFGEGYRAKSEGKLLVTAKEKEGDLEEVWEDIIVKEKKK